MTNFEQSPISFDPEHYSNRYKKALGVVFVLFLALLTATILIVILSSASREDLEQEYQLTITAISSQNMLQQPNLSTMSTPGLLPVAGRYAFAVQEGSPSFSAAEDCTMQVVSGTVLDQAGDPADGYQVLVWGDYTPPQVVLTGEVQGQPAGNWLISLPESINRRLWIQLTDSAHYVSEPVAFIFERDNCAQNQATITFIETTLNANE